MADSADVYFSEKARSEGVPRSLRRVATFESTEGAMDHWKKLCAEYCGISYNPLLSYMIPNTKI